MPISSNSYGLPPVKRAARRLGLQVGAVVVLIGGVFAFFYIKGRLTPQHVVIVENGNPFAVDVEIAGERLALAAGHHTTVRAHDGTITASARGPRGFAETVTLELPATGFTTAGRTAIYNIGGASELAVVTVSYGMPTSAAPEHPVQLIAPADRVVLLPPHTSGSIDEAFPKQVTTKRSGELVTHVCHADKAAGKLGCANLD